MKIDKALKGRGTSVNPTNRYSSIYQEAGEDGWRLGSEDTPSLPKTEVFAENAKSIIATNRSPDLPFEQSINPYRGCEHGCVYCFAHPTHAYLDLSPGLDFETKIFYKPNAVELLEKALSKPGYQCKTIAIGTNTDPYQPIERQYQVMRGILGLLSDFNHPVSIVTKGALIERDLDIFADMAARNLCSVNVSVTTLNTQLKRQLEPRTASPERRLQLIDKLLRAGVPTGILVAPVIPMINDMELENILAHFSCACHSHD